MKTTMDCALMQDLPRRLPGWVDACADLADIAVAICREICGEVRTDVASGAGMVRRRLSC
ncbi:hypothetical protein AO501_10635 [Mycobacterium gordonae]|uniref:Uncharacterized protein n=1 Tax=Mycobacterium gordonae TaxID=1778 RepID=A0A0Q2QIZ5_MYCGO|nr:hypothetical protein AO501_10635 [Mycobacterium gordonae]